MNIVSIIDVSGSMEPIAEQTIKSYNSYISELKQTNKEIYVTLVLFNEDVKFIYKNTYINHV